MLIVPGTWKIEGEKVADLVCGCGCVEANKVSWWCLCRNQKEQKGWGGVGGGASLRKGETRLKFDCGNAVYEGNIVAFKLGKL